MLNAIRVQIDSIDDQIVVLLGARQRAVEAAGRLKTDPAAIPAPDRVRFVIDRVSGMAASIGADPALIARIYEHLIDCFIEHDRRCHPRQV